VLSHSCNLGHNSIVGPFNTKHLCEFLQVLCAGFTDAEDSVAEPGHAQVAELLIEEGHTKLAGEQRHILNYCQTYTPLLVFSQLNDRGQQRLRQQVDADDVVNLLEL